MENNAKISNIEINENVDIHSDDYHYIGVIFENKYSDKPFTGKMYEYKTKKDLKEGQVIKIDSMYGKTNVCIVKDNIPEEELQFKELNKIKEI